MCFSYSYSLTKARYKAFWSMYVITIIKYFYSSFKRYIMFVHVIIVFCVIPFILVVFHGNIVLLLNEVYEIAITYGE